MNKPQVVRLTLALLCLALFIAALGLHFWLSREPVSGRQTLLDYSLAASFVFAVLMVLAAAWATPKEKWARQPAEPLAPSSTPGPVLREIHWLKRNPKFDRLLRTLLPLSYACVIGGAAAMAYFYYGSGEGMSPAQARKLTELKIEGFIATLLMVAVPFFSHAAVRTMKHRLGTDGRTLFVKLANGRQLSLAPEQLVYDARRIAYCDHFFPVGTGNQQSVYESGEVTTYLAPLLFRAKHLTPFAMMRYQFEHREPVTVMSGVFGVVVMCAIVAAGVWKLLL